MNDSREIIVFKARLAEQAERYDEMAEHMKTLVQKNANQPLSVEERNLLSVAFKNSVGARRGSLRIINSLENKQRNREQEELAHISHEYYLTVAKELSSICKDIIGLLDNYLIKESDSDIEASVFYWKMKGDYYRYLCEFPAKDDEDPRAQAEKAYNKATEIAEKELGPTHPVRLGLALNFSVFHFEILGKPDTACLIAKTAFDNSISQLEEVDQDSYRDSTLIMQLLRDNLTLWTNEGETAMENIADEAK